jgi:hypothetical protein
MTIVLPREREGWRAVEAQRACAGAADPFGGEGRAITEAPVLFGPGGLTEVLGVPASGAESVTLWAHSEPGTCFALASLEDAAGRAWV